MHPFRWGAIARTKDLPSFVDKKLRRRKNTATAVVDPSFLLLHLRVRVCRWDEEEKDGGS
jgi:hypothetical protein